MKLKNAVRNFTATAYDMGQEPQMTADFVEVIKDIVANQHLPRAALKKLLRTL
jgi:hypothetical protein